MDEEHRTSQQNQQKTSKLRDQILAHKTLQPNSKALVWGGKWGVCSLWNHCPHLFHSFLGKDFLYILTGAKHSHVPCRMQLKKMGKVTLLLSHLFPPQESTTLFIPVLSEQWRLLIFLLFPSLLGFPQALFLILFFPSMTSAPHMALPADGFWKWLHPPTSSASLSHDVTFRTQLPIFAFKACVLSFLFIKK